MFRTRRERRNAARERETDAENKVRHLSTLQSKLEDRCRVVNNYDQSGKAQRLQEVKQALQKASKTLADQTEKVKVMHHLPPHDMDLQTSRKTSGRIIVQH